MTGTFILQNMYLMNDPVSNDHLYVTTIFWGTAWSLYTGLTVLGCNPGHAMSARQAFDINEFGFQLVFVLAYKT